MTKKKQSVFLSKYWVSKLNDKEIIEKILKEIMAEIPDGYPINDKVVLGIEKGIEQGKQKALLEAGTITQAQLKKIVEQSKLQGRKQFAEEIKEKGFFKEGEGEKQITYIFEAYYYPHDERCEGSMCWCKTRAKRIY